MGCEGSTTHTSVPISNSIMHLMHAGKTDELIKKIDGEGANFNKDNRFNFRGDTLLHYACSKNNQKLVEYLLKKKVDKEVENYQGTKPVELSTDSIIIKMMGGMSSQLKSEKVEKKVEGSTLGKQEERKLGQVAANEEKNYEAVKKSDIKSPQKKSNFVQSHVYQKPQPFAIRVHQQQQMKTNKEYQQQFREERVNGSKERQRKEDPVNIFDFEREKKDEYREGNMIQSGVQPHRDYKQYHRHHQGMSVTQSLHPHRPRNKLLKDQEIKRQYAEIK